MRNIILNNGVQIPPIGFGVFQITDPNECERCVCEAVEVGYRMIDTAAHYHNEEAVGDAVKHCGVGRDKLFITSKLMAKKDAGYENTLKAFDESMKKLKLDYLDLVFDPSSLWGLLWDHGERWKSCIKKDISVPSEFLILNHTDW